MEEKLKLKMRVIVICPRQTDEEAALCCSPGSDLMARSSSLSSSCSTCCGAQVKVGAQSLHSTILASQVVRRIWLTYWLCRIMNSHALRAVPVLHR